MNPLVIACEIISRTTANKWNIMSNRLADLALGGYPTDLQVGADSPGRCLHIVECGADAIPTCWRSGLMLIRTGRTCGPAAISTLLERASSLVRHKWADKPHSRIPVVGRASRAEAEAEPGRLGRTRGPRLSQYNVALRPNAQAVQTVQWRRDEANT
jgi:hypothetical protein